MPPYYTPNDVARALAKHTPRKITRLLEPAVGTGILLEPLKQRLYSSEITCIDRDSEALAQLRLRFSPLFWPKLKIVQGDFLKWSDKVKCRSDEDGFDCVLMNPPFVAKRSEFVDLDCVREMPGIGEDIKRVPVEVAFIIKAIRLLRPGGRLLAVVPSSIVTSLSTTWLRDYLLQVGSVRYVHELPRYTFKEVSARVYLFVYQKQAKQHSVLLLNHDLAKPESILISKVELKGDLRLDYSFHSARRQLDELIKMRRRLMWRPIRAVAKVLRGHIKSPAGAQFAVHTTSYNGGFWELGSRGQYLARGDTEQHIKSGDLMIARVGKNCSSSCGIVTNAAGYAASDCVIMIRPHEQRARLKLLFAIRTTFGMEITPSLIERGTGAPYLTVAELPHVMIPINLADIYQRDFSKYCLSVRRKRLEEMKNIEKRVERRLCAGSRSC
jgi:tRNA1(Val) A37 N6-methylase TrmN6